MVSAQNISSIAILSVSKIVLFFNALKLLSISVNTRFFVL